MVEMAMIMSMLMVMTIIWCNDDNDDDIQNGDEMIRMMKVTMMIMRLLALWLQELAP